jgi:restriction system protein
VWVGRSRGFTGVLVQMQRQAERDRKARAAAESRARVEADRARRAFERASAANQEERARLYAVARVAEVAALNESLAAGISDLEGLFSGSLAADDFLDFESLKETVQGQVLWRGVPADA